MVQDRDSNINRSWHEMVQPQPVKRPLRSTMHRQSIRQSSRLLCPTPQSPSWLAKCIPQRCHHQQRERLWAKTARIVPTHSRIRMIRDARQSLLRAQNRSRIFRRTCLGKSLWLILIPGIRQIQEQKTTLSTVTLERTQLAAAALRVTLLTVRMKANR